MTVDGQRTRLGVLGGTFDPPQNGHISVAQAVMDKLRLDHVLFVPA
ncbi:MAG: nicotinate-nucleotide adenylyltransferase, partial [Actinomycetales bacterium]|nr:nicotinate-nucleotide adenylyltransferase [Actinomycetales bacterium]